MAEEDNNEQAQAETSASSGGSSQKNPLVALLLLVNTVGLGVVAFLQYQFMQMEAKRPDLTELLKQGQQTVDPDFIEEDKPVEEITKESLVNLDTFTVNLAQGDGPRRYVRMNAVLKMSTDSQITEVEMRKPQIRDTIISILNQKRPEDILKKDGKLYLKEQIKSAVNSFLVDGKVVDVFYVGFQIN
jgi:flagellar FliL protein